MPLSDSGPGEGREAGAAGATVRVPPLPPRSAGYDVIVRAGGLAALPELLGRDRTLTAVHRYAVIAPADVASLYGEPLLSGLRGAGLQAEPLTFAPGEASKTRESWASLTDRMLELGFGRDSAIIALGGGVAGDLAGFVAATYMRGIPVVQVPTTLLAMVDAAVGGKTGVDTPAGKNLVGAVHPPSLVLADPALLRTLPPTELTAGLAEAVKHGVMLDAAYFDWIAAHAAELDRQATTLLERLVLRSVELKADVAGSDPYEDGRRAILNFGHTVGHALERQSGWDLAHGPAVAIGMVVEAVAGEAAGITAPGTAQRLAGLLARLGLPAATRPDDAAALLAAMRLDKKARRAIVRFALPAVVGQPARAADGAWTHELPEAVLRSALDEASHGLRSV